MTDERFQERTEKATPKRREDARKEGQVARSAEVSSFAVIVASLLGFLAFGPYVVHTVATLAISNFEQLAQIELTAYSITGHMATWVAAFAKAALIPALIAVLAGAAVALLQVGWRPTAKPLALRWERVDVARGLKRLCSGRSLYQLTRDTLKLAAIAWVAYLAIDAESAQFAVLADMSVGQTVLALGGMALRVGLKLGAALLLIAAADYAYQRYDFEKSLRMTRHQLKEELKETEGDPQVKSRRRSIRRELSQKRTSRAVASADVVLTDRSQQTLALRYDRGSMAAPLVVAQGTDGDAEAIKAVARRHAVPVVDDSIGAHAQREQVVVGQEIPESLFETAAAALAVAYRVRQGGAQ